MALPSLWRQAVLIAVVLVLVFSAIVLMSLHKHLQIRDQQMLQSSRLVEQSLTRTFESVETFLLFLSQRVQEAMKNGQAADAEMLREVMEFTPHIRQIVLVHGDQVVADSHGRGAGGLLDWKRIAFDSSHSLPLNKGLHIGTPVAQRFLPMKDVIAPASGRRSLLPVMMQFGDDNKPGWALVAALNPLYLENLIQEGRIHDHQNIDLLRLDGLSLSGDLRNTPSQLPALLEQGLQESVRTYLQAGWYAEAQVLRLSSRYDFALLERYSALKVSQSWLQQNSTLLLFLLLLQVSMVAVVVFYLQQVQRKTRLQQEVKLLHEAIEQLPLAVLLQDVEQHALYQNPAYAHFFAAHDSARPSLDGLRPWFSVTDWQQLQQDIHQGAAWNGELTVSPGLMPTQTIQAHIAPVSNNDGALSHIVGLFQDVTAAKQAEEQQRVASVAFEVQEGILVMDQNKRILRVNRSFCEQTGYEAHQVTSRSLGFLQSDKHDAGFYRQMAQQIVQAGTWQGEVYLRRQNGSSFPVWQVISAVRSPDGEVSHYVCSFSDMSARKAHEEKIAQLAFYDPLTDLPNRRLFQDRFAQAVRNCHRNGQHAALLLLDLDHFKAINDTLGHDQGDRLLQEVSERLRQTIREPDTLARMGGDEFLIVLEGLAADRAQAQDQCATIGEKILLLLQHPSEVLSDRRPLSASIGISLFGFEVTNRDVVMKQADLALYESKKRGRNQFQMFADSLQSQLDHQVHIETEFRKALQLKQLHLHYQAQVNAQGQVIGAEALVRWRNGDVFVSPAVFIPIAERSELILELGEQVLQQAMQAMQGWNLKHPQHGLSLSVNISARQFAQNDFVDQVAELLQQYTIEAGQIQFELTENLMLQSVSETLHKLKQLKQLGVGLDLDDFGTGYSSLSYLHQLPLQAMKIDRSFIDELNQSPSAESIVRSILNMAHSMEIEAIAEGVETAEQFEFLKALGCRLFQGFWFSKPVPEAEFLNYWQQAKRPADLSARQH